MIAEAHMQAIRAVREQLRALKPVIDGISAAIDEDVCLLPERLWWTEIEDEHSAVAVSLDSVEEHIDDALDEISKVTGEDEPEIDYKRWFPPLPDKLPSKEEAFEARRIRAARIKASRGQQ
jgi:hypothetical protein